MFEKEAIFRAQACITPDFAAKLANLAAQYDASVHLECAGIRLCIDSLISILAMDLRQGGSVRISAEGKDEVRAVEAISALLSKEN